MVEEKYMRRAIRLARLGTGWVDPNPMVGAVLVKDGKIIGEGFHEYFGGPHAEVNALKNFCQAEVPSWDGTINEMPVREMMEKILESARGLLQDATLYLTLEPCAHEGKTPPCAGFIVESGISRVVVGLKDPNPDVNGKGIGILRAGGVEVTTGVLEKEIRSLNEVFIKYITTRDPFVVLKTAMTLDGKTATITNASRWITGEASRKMVHRMRQQLGGVMVGVNTIMFDDPQLNIRLQARKKWKNPLKIVTDTHGRIPLGAKIFKQDPQLALIATTGLASKSRLRDMERLGAQVLICPVKDDRVDLRFLMRSLGVMGIDSVMIEGGGALAFSAIKAGIVDKIVTFIAPKILGGKNAPTPVGGDGIPLMEQAVMLEDMKARKIGQDIMVEGRIMM
ncbi:MAG: bifunctional diaminohydroxyphosphoribosylaminopyrimidine deaminase/5-amino-6-(5-phosphoribosylamino)uracil reductase RibD [Bacteroidales bacterium]|nr:bifunctional diaminohydroxyphosphoribosylaminopyrimidine deaminase/5-amino-6-(5-phosphoribosylamino)uracil reductase RibD [Bacteroidales bacterium]